MRRQTASLLRRRAPRFAAAAAGLTAAASGVALAHPAGGHPTGEDAATGTVRPAIAPTAEARIRLGSADFAWESVPGWCRRPDARPLGNTHGAIVIDAAGLIYYNTDTDRSIMVHRPDGTFVRSMAESMPAMHGMQIRREAVSGSGAGTGSGSPAGATREVIYAAHLAGKQVVKLALDGTVIWTIGLPVESGHYDDGPAGYNPTAVAVASNGDVYIADGYGRNWIHHFDAERRYVRSFGGPGSEPGRFRTCHGMIVDDRGDTPTLLVCDRENRRIQRFALDGTFIEVVATGLRRPCGLSIHGDLTAVAELEGRVTVLGADFKPVAHLGDNPDRSHWANNGVPSEAWTDGVFTAPHAVCFDADGNLYVMDWNAAGRISKLRRIAPPAVAPDPASAND